MQSHTYNNFYKNLNIVELFSFEENKLQTNRTHSQYFRLIFYEKYHNLLLKYNSW